jgi:hypothetical protein
MKKNSINIRTLRKHYHYDPETGVFTRKTSAGCRKAGSISGTTRVSRYFVLKVEKTKIYAHRAAWALTHGRWPKDEIDHVNNDGLDNRLCNLREASRSQNQGNAKRRSDNTSGVKNVSWLKRGNCFIVRVQKDGRRPSRRFKTLEEAAQFLEEFREEHHGEFAKAG